MPVAMSITHDLGRAQSWLRGLELKTKDLRPVLMVFGEYMVTNTKTTFAIGGRPRKWKPSLRALATGGKTLIKSGRLRSSITKTVRGGSVFVGTNVVYGGAHQFGVRKTVQQSVRSHTRRTRSGATTTVKAHTRRMRMNLPARPFLKMSLRSKRYLNRLLGQHFGLGRGLK